MKYSILQRIRSMTDAQLVEVCFRMAEIHPESFEKMVMDNQPTIYKDRISGKEITLDHTQNMAIRNMSQTTANKIAVIKQLRAWFGLDLKTAKDICEQHFIP